jgi:hypothetical protein
VRFRIAGTYDLRHAASGEFPIYRVRIHSESCRCSFWQPPKRPDIPRGQSRQPSLAFLNRRR